MFWKKKDKPKALQINDANFNDIIETDKGILLDFYADWCGPCQALGPIIDELSEEFKDRAIIGKVNVDQNPNLTAFLDRKSVV